MKPVSVAIVGATGLVGRQFLQVMEEYNCTVSELRLFASKRSAGTKMTYQDKEYIVQSISPGCFIGVDYALFSAGAAISRQAAKQAVSEGAVVIDNSSAWRMDPEVPLVVPEINLEDAVGASLIANPNCSTIQSVLPLAPLDQALHLTHVEYHTYQAVSGSGQSGLEDLKRTRNGESPQLYPYSISSTAIPQIDIFVDGGFTKEEQKMIDETKKILHRENLPVMATCVRIPVEHGHGVSIRASFQSSFQLDQIRAILSQQPGIVVLDNPTENIYPTSMHAIGSNDVFVGRLRQDPNDAQTVWMYVVADNIRKGAATNAVQIMMELMIHA